MTQTGVNWDADLPIDPDEEYQALIRALRRTQGFGLFFVSCSRATGQEIIERTTRDLPRLNIQVLTFETALDNGNLYQAIADYLSSHQQPVDILFIQGLEHSLLEYEETKRRLVRWTEDDIRQYSKKGAPRILANLNQQREHFRDSFNTRLVFLLPLFVTKYIIHRAPDFFDWRSGVFEIPMNQKNLTSAYQKLWVNDDSQEYRNWTASERLKRHLELNQLIEEPHQNPDQKADLYREQGLLFGAEDDYEEAINCYEQALALKFDDYKTLKSKGDAFNNLGRYEEAITVYKQALAIKPDYHEALSSKGNALFNLGRYEEAIAFHNQALAVKPDYYKALFSKGVVLLSLGRYDDAITTYNIALEIQPDSQDMFSFRGYAYLIQGLSEEAEKDFLKALEINPLDPMANQGLMSVYSKIGNQIGSEDIDAFLAAVENLISALSSKWASQIQEQLKLSLSQGQMQLMKTLASAAGLSQETIEHQIEEVWQTPTRMVQSLKNLRVYLQAKQAQQQHDDRTALDLLNQLCATINDLGTSTEYQYEILNDKGVALGKLERYEEAIAAYDQALDIKPDFHGALYNKGLALRQLGRYEEAIAAYDQALDIKPDFHMALSNKGSALINLGRYEEAIATYDQALTIKPDYHEALYFKGNALGKLGRYEDAIAAYDQALHIKPDYNYALYFKGSALDDLGRYEDAIAAYDQALDIKPDDHLALYLKGSALGRLERYEEAIAAFDQAINIQPTAPNLYYGKACCYGLQGDVEQALIWLQQAIDLAPEKYREMARTDSDFDLVRDDPRFQALLTD